MSHRLPSHRLVQAYLALDEGEVPIGPVADWALRSDSERWRKEAIERLEWIGSDYELQRGASKSREDQYKAVLLLGKLGGQRAIEELEKLTEHPDPILSHFARKELGKLEVSD